MFCGPDGGHRHAGAARANPARFDIRPSGSIAGLLSCYSVYFINIKVCPILWIVALPTNSAPSWRGFPVGTQGRSAVFGVFSAVPAIAFGCPAVASSTRRQQKTIEAIGALILKATLAEIRTSSCGFGA